MPTSRPLLAVTLLVLAAAACSSSGGEDADADAATPGASSSGDNPSGSSGASSSSGMGSSSSSSSGASGSSSGASTSGETPSGDGGASSSGGETEAGTDASSDAGPPIPVDVPWEQNCNGPAITQANVLSHFAPAATETTFGSVWASARKRQCQDQTGCLAWEPASTVDMYRIVYDGSSMQFIQPTTMNVPVAGTITCEVPGPSCKLTVGPMTSNVYPDEQGRPLGITPRVDGWQVQVGNWSPNPSGYYLQYTSSIVTAGCLWGSTVGRSYTDSGRYVETELVVWGEL